MFWFEFLQTQSCVNCINWLIFVCLCVWCLSSHSWIFHSYGNVTITGEGLQIFALCSALMAIEQWGFFSVPRLLWRESSVYNGYLRGPVKLTPIAERLAAELSLSVFTTKVCRGYDSNTQPSACSTNALTHCVIATVIDWLYIVFSLFDVYMTHKGTSLLQGNNCQM